MISHASGERWALFHADCRRWLSTREESSVDSIVTDPPYELGFMGKRWDASGIAYDVDLWRECLRVLKPGGYLLAFGGTRTYHRMTVAIEDAGFEIRDSIHWLYGSGFPKSLDVSKAIDKRGGIMPWQADFAQHLREVKPVDVTTAQINAHVANGTKSNFWGHFIDTTSQPLLPTVEQYRKLREILPIDPSWDAMFLPEAEREVVGRGESGVAAAFGDGQWATPEERAASTSNVYDITAPATDAARQWEGWGTALKPAHEPIVVARKPLAGTVAANVLKHGTGALNIDGCRVGSGREKSQTQGAYNGTSDVPVAGARSAGKQYPESLGRWPANLVLTHAAECGADECAPSCAVAELDQQSGVTKDGVAVRHRGVSGGTIGTPGKKPIGTPDMGYGGSGGASRFFTVTEWDEVPFRYVAKPSKRERNAGLEELEERPAAERYSTISTLNAEHQQRLPAANIHPTVKPLALMRWLVRLVTPPGGTVLDPFAGSGTTLVAAITEGFQAIGVEMTEDYLPIIVGRAVNAKPEEQQMTIEDIL